MKSITSVSPFGKSYESDAASEENKINNFIDNDRKCVVIQGLGFVGGAMMAALANASNEINEPLYNVIGVDLCDENNFWNVIDKLKDLGAEGILVVPIEKMIL